jgi:hypothetical protein
MSNDEMFTTREDANLYLRGTRRDRNCGLRDARRSSDVGSASAESGGVRQGRRSGRTSSVGDV